MRQLLADVYPELPQDPAQFISASAKVKTRRALEKAAQVIGLNEVNSFFFSFLATVTELMV